MITLGYHCSQGNHELCNVPLCECPECCCSDWMDESEKPRR